MEQQHLEMPANMELPKTTIAQALFPINRFHHFHKDANINFQLNRFLIPGLEDLFAEIGRNVETYDDWKKMFSAKAAAFEKTQILFKTYLPIGVRRVHKKFSSTV